MKFKQGKKYKLGNLDKFLKTKRRDLYKRLNSLKRKRREIRKIYRYSEVDEETKEGLLNSLKKIDQELDDVYSTTIDLLEEEIKKQEEEFQKKVKEQETILSQLPPPPPPLGQSELSEFQEITELRFKRAVRQFEARFSVDLNFLDLPLNERLKRAQEDLLTARNRIIELLEKLSREGFNPPYKIDILYRARFIEPRSDETSDRFVRTGYHPITSFKDIKHTITELVLDILASRKLLSDLNDDKYSFVFYFPISVIVIISKYDPGTAIVGGWKNEEELIEEFKNKGYDKHSCSDMKLPECISKKKACINIQNTDNKCFLWSILRSIYPKDQKDHPQRISDLIQHQSEIDLCGIELPFDINVVKSSKLKKFEEINKLSLFIFQLRYKILENQQESIDIFPVYISKNFKNENRYVYLLVYKNHFFVIKDLSRLLSDESGMHKRYFCPNCLCGSRNIKKMEEHKEYCLNNFDPIKSSSPYEHFVEFKRQDALQWNHFAVFCDFECIFKDEKFIPISVSVFCEFFNIFEFIIDRDPYMLSKKLWQVYFSILDKFKQILNNPSKPPDNIRKPIQDKDKCWICNEITKICASQYGGWYYDKLVIDHDHVTGEFRGYAHNSCNLNLRLDRIKIPVYFHNGSGFDFHIIIKYLPFDLLKEYFKNDKFEVENIVAKSTEKFMSFDIGNLRFIDSLNLLNCSIEKLGEILNLSNAFNSVIKYYSKYTHLLNRKLRFPYQWLDSFDKLFETQMPAIEFFKSDLKVYQITKEEYNDTVRTFEELKCRNILEYLEIYNKMDVLILADAINFFRKKVFSEFKIDPAHFISTPSCAWSCLLRMLQLNHDNPNLIRDISMFQFIELGIRGGMCGTGTLTTKEIKDPSKEAILYLDANNLYGTAMMSELPWRDFKWIKELQLKCIEKIFKDFDRFKGYSKQELSFLNNTILEVDLEYPFELHEYHHDYPLAPSHYDVGDYIKLCQTLENKSKYVVFGPLLILYVELGLKVTKVHRGIKFISKAILKDYIMRCIELRKSSKTEMEKTVWKLMVNAVFGKTIENDRKKVHVKLLTDEKKIMKRIASPFFAKADVIIPDNLVAIRMRKKNIILNKPIFLGFAILEISKFIMFNFHYKIAKKSFPSIQVMYTDTDSLIYYLNFPKETFIRTLSDHIDLSAVPNLAKSLNLDPNKNKMVPGKFKIETNEKNPDDIIRVFIAKAPKMYEIIYNSKYTKLKTKGFKAGLVTNEDFSKTNFSKEFYSIKSSSHNLTLQKLHRTFTQESNNKRIVISNKISIPYGFMGCNKNSVKVLQEFQELF